MKKEYDFSKGERGKFFNPQAKINLPIYLEPDIEAFIREQADKKKKDAETLVNELLRRDIENIQSILE